jgi:hypothetical protein
VALGHWVRPRASWLLGVALLGSLVVQWPALASDFRHDDFLTFYQAANLRPVDFMLTPHGGHLLMTRNAIHLAFFDLFDLDPFPYFVAAVLTHLVNVALLFLVARRLTRSGAIAAFVAALWGMAPVQQASVNWVAIYGNLTAATFTLWPLAELTKLAVERRAPSAWALMRWGVLLAAAATSLGPGLAVALVFAGVSWLLLPRECGRDRVATCMAGVALALVVLYVVIRPGGSFEFASIWFSKLGMVTIARLFVGLLSYGIACLIGGPWLTFGEDGVPVGPLQGAAASPVVHVSWVLAALTGIAVGWAWLRARELQRRQILAFLALLAAIYGLVAVARAPLAIGLWGVDAWAVTARYQYVATLGWGGCLALALAEVARAWSARRRPAWRAPAWLAPGVLGLWSAAVVVPYAAAARHVDTKYTQWSRRVFAEERARLRNEIAAAGDAPEVLIRNRPFPGMAYIQDLVGARAFPGAAAVFVLMQHNAPAKITHVRFIDSDPALVEDLRSRPHTQIAGLLVTSEEAAHRSANGAAVPPEREPVEK